MSTKIKPEKKNRTLIVCQHFWPESFRVNDVADFLINKGQEIEVLCGMPNYPSGKFYDGYSYTKKRVQIHNKVNIRRVFEIPRGNNTNFRIFLNYISFPIASLFHVPRMLFRKIDRVLIFTYSPVYMAIAGIVIGKLKRKEITIYVLDLWPENLLSVLKIKNKFLLWLVTTTSHWHYRQADKIMVLSESMKTRIIEVTKLPPEKVIILPQVCEKIYEKEITDPSLVTRFKGKFNILFTGNISPAQSFETIVDAARRVRAKGIEDINWIIVGDGMSKKWLEDYVRKFNLEDIFYFEGQKPIEEIPKYTTIADLLVGCLVKSDFLEATLPAKLTSYIAAGRPIVIAMDGEARELVNNLARCGYACPTEDSAKLAENIMKIHGLSEKERSALGKNAKEYHFKNLERNLVLERLNDFITN